MEVAEKIIYFTTYIIKKPLKAKKNQKNPPPKTVSAAYASSYQKWQEKIIWVIINPSKKQTKDQNV